MGGSGSGLISLLGCAGPGLAFIVALLCPVHSASAPPNTLRMVKSIMQCIDALPPPSSSIPPLPASPTRAMLCSTPLLPSGARRSGAPEPGARTQLREMCCDMDLRTLSKSLISVPIEKKTRHLFRVDFLLLLGKTEQVDGEPQLIKLHTFRPLLSFVSLLGFEYWCRLRVVPSLFFFISIYSIHYDPLQQVIRLNLTITQKQPPPPFIANPRHFLGLLETSRDS